MLYEDKEFTLIKGYTKYFICRETTEVLSIKDRKNTYKNTYKILKQVPNSKNPSCNYFIVTLVDDEGKRKNRFMNLKFSLIKVNRSSSMAFFKASKS